jgi:mRNA interferase MazF
MDHPYQPDRGDFINLNFSPQAGTEQAGLRPALVLSPQRFNVAIGVAFVCPITSQMKGGSFEVPIPVTCRVKGAVLVAHFRSVDWLARGARLHSRAPTSLVDDIIGRLSAIIETDEIAKALAVPVPDRLPKRGA